MGFLLCYVHCRLSNYFMNNFILYIIKIRSLVVMSISILTKAWEMCSCVDLWCSEEGSDRRVELRFCLATKSPLPVTVQRCHVDCHVPCQLTEWTSWTLCKQPCPGARSRTRQLIGEFDRLHQSIVAFQYCCIPIVAVTFQNCLNFLWKIAADFSFILRFSEMNYYCSFVRCS